MKLKPAQGVSHSFIGKYVQVAVGKDRAYFS